MNGLVVPFQVNAGAIHTTEDYDDLVRYQVIDALITNEGERLMNPTWGCNILALLFDPSDSLARSDTAAHIKQALAHFVPRAFIESVQLDVDTQSPQIVHIKVRFKASRYVETTEVGVRVDLSKVDQV